MDFKQNKSLLEKTSSKANSYYREIWHLAPQSGGRPLFWILMILGNIFISISSVAIFLRHPTLNHRFMPTTSTHPPTQPVVNEILSAHTLHYPLIQPAPSAWLNSTYTGPPSHASDAAWARLQAVRGVAITPAQASSLNLPPSGLSAWNGTVATILGVQHNLHCIRVIRQILYPAYYYPGQNSAAEQKARVGHAGHCLEAIRQSVMCTPDLTPRGVRWEDEEREGIAMNPSARLQCLDWESLLRNIRAKSYDLDDLWEANPVLVEPDAEKQ
ncbi:MAG: hypothetical protein Q9195_008533 [Heterodermia aff. obscurata]